MADEADVRDVGLVGGENLSIIGLGQDRWRPNKKASLHPQLSRILQEQQTCQCFIESLNEDAL